MVSFQWILIIFFFIELNLNLNFVWICNIMSIIISINNVGPTCLDVASKIGYCNE